MAEVKTQNRGGGRAHPYCKKGFEPGTNRYKTAVENAATILAKGEGKASQEEKDQLTEQWSIVFYEDALLKLAKYHDPECTASSKKAAIAELVSKWRAFPDEETWSHVELSNAEMTESPPPETEEKEGEGKGSRDPDNPKRNRGKNHKKRGTSPSRGQVTIKYSISVSKEKIQIQI